MERPRTGSHRQHIQRTSDATIARSLAARLRHRAWGISYCTHISHQCTHMHRQLQRWSQPRGAWRRPSRARRKPPPPAAPDPTASAALGGPSGGLSKCTLLCWAPCRQAAAQASAYHCRVGGVEDSAEAMPGSAAVDLSVPQHTAEAVCPPGREPQPGTTMPAGVLPRSRLTITCHASGSPTSLQHRQADHD